MSTISIKKKGCPGRDHMVVGFTTTYAISANPPNIVSLNPAHREVYSIQHYVIMVVRAIRAAERTTDHGQATGKLCGSVSSAPFLKYI